MSTQENRLLVAWCRLRKDFRIFRLDRIRKLEIQNEKFEPHTIPITEYGEGFITAAVIDPFGNTLGIMYNRHYLEILSSIKTN